MDLTITQKIIGFIVMVVLIGFAVKMAMDDLNNSRAATMQAPPAIAEPAVSEPATK
ncbi:MAG: hypothetical protein HQL69_16095 [Magnetococcales bacterium]|nr:hypothetical protein [Magnetococcales bacterium]